MNIKKIILLSILILSCNIVFSDRELSSATPTEKVLIYYYQDKTEVDKYGYYSYVIPDAISKEFKKSGGYNIQSLPVTIQYIDKRVSEKEFRSHIKMLTDRGKKFSADYIITGSYYIKEKRIFIKTQIFDVSQQKIVKVSESSSELGTLLINIIDNLTVRINAELGKFKKMREVFDYNTRQRRFYGSLSLGLGGLAAVSFGVGYHYFHFEMKKANSDYNELEHKYNTSTDYDEATKLHNDMEDKKDDADMNALLRNISYGVGAASLLATAYFTYKYYVYRSIGNNLKSDNGLYLFTPIYCYRDYNSMSVINSRRTEQFIGAMISWRF